MILTERILELAGQKLIEGVTFYDKKLFNSQIKVHNDFFKKLRDAILSKNATKDFVNDLIKDSSNEQIINKNYIYFSYIGPTERVESDDIEEMGEIRYDYDDKTGLLRFIDDKINTGKHFPSDGNADNNIDIKFPHNLNKVISLVMKIGKIENVNSLINFLARKLQSSVKHELIHDKHAYNGDNNKADYYDKNGKIIVEKYVTNKYEMETWAQEIADVLKEYLKSKNIINKLKNGTEKETKSLIKLYLENGLEAGKLYNFQKKLKEVSQKKYLIFIDNIYEYLVG